MKRRIILSIVFVLAFCIRAFAQPSEAQIKKDLMNPGVIEIVIRGKGSFEKFVENRAVVNEYYRSVTVRRKSDKPGITIDVLGDVVYRLIGGRWVFRKMRLAGNTYGGIANPTVAELNKLVEKLTPNDVDNMSQDFIGEIESIKISPFPNWEWHSPNSVSFNVVLVHSYIYRGGAYTQTDKNESAYPDVFVDRVERTMRWRIYRDSEKAAWKSMTWTKAGRIGDYMKNASGESVPMMKLLGRKKYSNAQVEAMPRPTRVPLITE
jgi:hypothetical protein